VFSLIKKVQGPKKEKVMGGLGGSLCYILIFVLFVAFRGAGGGKCPEEEHTTCSGGPTIILSQARFTGRENISIL
jgi:hypothetical protein